MKTVPRPDWDPPRRRRRGSDDTIAVSLAVGTSSTIYRIKRRFVEEGLEQALGEEPRPGAEALRRADGWERALGAGVPSSSPSASPG
jgi:hypothetical protein